MQPSLNDSMQKILTEAGRLKVLIHLSGTPSHTQTIYDRFTTMTHEVLGTPVSLLTLVAHDYQYFKSQVGLNDPWKSQGKTPLSHSFCKHVVATNEPLIVENANEFPLVRYNPAIRDLGVVAYLGMPLTLSDGTRLGSFCAIDHEPKQWDETDIAIIKEFSEIVSAEFELRSKAAIDRALTPEFEALHSRIDALIASLDTSLPKGEFLARLRAARQEHGIL
jgi:GAF domain-containing protein